MAEMADQERDAFLAEVRVAVLAIERPEKGSLCAPVWYRYRDGCFEIAMANGSAKAKLLRRYGRAASASKTKTIHIGMSQRRAK